MERYLYHKYKGRYRILAEIDRNTNDFPRDANGDLDDGCEMYIKCRYGNKIYAFGRDGHKEMQLVAYIPSLGRGRNIKKEMKKLNIGFYDYDESDEEVMFKFSSKDIDDVAPLLKAIISGANISPFSSKNLPKSKESLPDEKMKEYKDIISNLDKGDMLFIKNMNIDFMNNILAKKLRESGKKKPFDYTADQKKMGLARDVKTYIYKKGLFDEYLEFVSKKVDERISA